jgi:hypothetical protein
MYSLSYGSPRRRINTKKMEKGDDSKQINIGWYAGGAICVAALDKIREVGFGKGNKEKYYLGLVFLMGRGRDG